MDRTIVRRGTLAGLLLAALTVLAWGVTFVNTKALLVRFSALEIQVLRFAVAYAALWLIHPRGGLVPWRDELVFLLMGLTGVAVYQLLENCAIDYTNASNVAILVSTCPVVTALIVRFLGHGAPLRPLFFVGCTIAMVGVALVSFSGIASFHFNPVGDVMALGAMLSWGFYSYLVGRPKTGGYSQLFVVRRMFFWALVLMVPFVLFGLTDAGRTAAGGTLSVTLAPSVNAVRFAEPLAYVNLGFLGLLASAACFVMWNRACQTLGVVRCTVGLYLIPAVTMLFAYAFLGETLTFASALGGALIVAGVALSGNAP